jgi:hypothetical protein
MNWLQRLASSGLTADQVVNILMSQPGNAGKDPQRLRELRHLRVLLPEQEVERIRQEVRSQRGAGMNWLSKLAVRMDAEQMLMALRPQLAAAAQQVYDSWDDAMVEELNGGGICQDIAEAIVNVLYSSPLSKRFRSLQASTVSQTMDDQHVYVVCAIPTGVYVVDIPPSLYESGGGYSWTKKEGVTFTADYVVIDRLDPNPRSFEQYAADY